MDYPTAPPVTTSAQDPLWRRIGAHAARVDWRRGLERADPRPLWRRRPGWLRSRDDERLSALGMAGYAAGLALFVGVLLASVAVFAMAGLTTLDLMVGLPVCVGAVGCGLAALRRDHGVRWHRATLPLAAVGIVLPFVWATVWIRVVGW
jgi:hypothetical protein